MRICDCWHVCATTNARASTPTITATRNQGEPPGRMRPPQRPTSACGAGVMVGSDRLGGRTELGPDVRKQHDHQDHDGTQDRDRKHCDFEALDVCLRGQEFDLTLSASVVDHSVSPTPPGCGGGPAAAGFGAPNLATCLIS